MEKNPIIVALDVAPGRALELAQMLKGVAGAVKVGSELFTAAGPEIIKEIHGKGVLVFLDLKWHDIPNTVARSVANATKLGVRMMNVHTSGGLEMMQAAKQAARATSDVIGWSIAPLVLGVTVLTSFDQKDLASIGVLALRVTSQVERLAKLAVEAGLDGLVCSGEEVGAVRALVPAGFQLVVPGVRLPGADVQDQKRVVTPRQAMDNGANWVVIGRQIYEADDPLKATEEILATLE